MTWKPFANLEITNGQLVTTDLPSYIQFGSWFLVINRQVKDPRNPSRHFAQTTRNPNHDRRVILAERPTTLPRMLRVHVRSTSEANKHRSVEHPDHSHTTDYPECCCVDEKRRTAYVTKSRWHVESTNLTVTTFSCNEPENSNIWAHL